MRFLTPLSLLWALPVAATIIILYLLKMRRQDLRVPAAFLWPNLTADIRANAPFQKLRFSWLLVMQLCVSALIIAALAGPLFRAKGLNGDATVIVLDDSASMQATDVAPTRFGYALQRVRTLIGSMAASDRLSLIVAGPQTQIAFPLSSDKAQMTQALRKVLPSDAPSNVGEALRLAASLVSNKPNARIIILSDGNFPQVTDFSPGKASLTYVAIGTSHRNAAITSFDSSLTPGGTLQCFASIHNYDESSMDVKAVFTVDGEVLDAKEMSLPALQDKILTFTALPSGKSAHLSIEAKGDILSADNQATIFLKGEGTIRTLLVTSGNLFLENALSLDPQVRLEKATDVPDYERQGASGPGRYDLVVFDNTAPTPVKAPAIWSLGVPSPEFGVKDIGIAQNPQIIDWKQADPVLRFANLSDINIEQAHRVATIPGHGATVLAQGSDGPLIVATKEEGQRTLYSSWSLLDSDFPLRVSFPIFVVNSVGWLTSGTDSSANEAGGISAQAGQIFMVPTPGGSAKLIDPDGMSENLDAASGFATIRSANRVGLYHIAAAGLQTTIAVNLLDETASDVRTKTTINLSGSPVTTSKTTEFTLSEFWRPIICVTLLLMAFEWWFFVRRS